MGSVSCRFVRAPTSRSSIVLVLVLLLLPGACAGEAPDVPLGPDGEPDPELVIGRDVYSRRCANCHSADGSGGTGPKLSDGVVVETYPDPLDQRAIIADGRNAMPSFSGSLSTEQLDAVVRYTREVLG